MKFRLCVYLCVPVRQNYGLAPINLDGTQHIKINPTPSILPTIIPQKVVGLSTKTTVCDSLEDDKEENDKD